MLFSALPFQQAFESDDGHRQSAFDSDDDNADADGFYTERRSPGAGVGDAGPPPNHAPNHDHATSGVFSVHSFPHLHQHSRPEIRPVNDHRPPMANDGRFDPYFRSTIDIKNERAQPQVQPAPVATPGYALRPETDDSAAARATHRSTPPLARSSAPIPQPPERNQEAPEKHSEDSARPAPPISLPAARAGVGGRFSIHVLPPPAPPHQHQHPLIAHPRSRSPVDAVRHQPRSPLTCGPVLSWHEQGRAGAAQGGAAAEVANQQQQRRGSSDGSGHQSWSNRDHHGLGVGQASRAGPTAGNMPELSGLTRLPKQAEVFSRSG